MVLKWTELPPPFIYRFYVDYSPVKETSQALIIILPIMCRFHSDGPNQGADYPGSQKRKEIKYMVFIYRYCRLCVVSIPMDPIKVPIYLGCLNRSWTEKCIFWSVRWGGCTCSDC